MADTPPPASAPSLDGVAEPLRGILASAPGIWPVLDPEAATRHRVQVVLGVIEPGAAGGLPTLRQASFRAGADYFYPASTVKLFAAIAALERLAALRAETRLAIDADTPLVFQPLFADQQVVDRDPSNLAGGRVTVRHEIRKIFLVSDNDAFNRLYDLVGQDGLAASLARAGLGEARIVHRLEQTRSAEDHRRAPRVELVGEGFRHVVPERVAAPLPPAPEPPGMRLGTAFLRGGERVEGPMDFAPKNRISLVDLQRGLCKVVRPDVDCGGGSPFALSDADRALIVGAMGEVPRESANPRYDPAEYPDGYVKFIFPGVARAVAPERFRIHDKTGEAYGFLTENAWLVDRETGRSFFLAATLYANADGVLNDDHYEYDSVSKPFLEALGEAAARWFWSVPADDGAPASAPAVR